MQRISPCGKFISAATAFTFIFTSTVGATPILPAPEFQPPLKISVPPIEIPGDLAHVEKMEGRFEETKPSLIYIQDAHSNYDAQQSIKSLLKYLHEEEGIDLVLMEGAASELDINGLRFFEKDRLNKDVLDRLAKKGHLTGLELYLLEAGENYKAVGVEDANLYANNLKAFRRVIKARPRSERFLQELRGEVDRLSNRLLNRDLREFVRKYEAYRTSTIDLRHFLAILKEEAQNTLGKDLMDPVTQVKYPQLYRFALLESYREKTDTKQLQIELGELTAQLKEWGVSGDLIARVEGLSTEDWNDVRRGRFQTGPTDGFESRPYEIIDIVHKPR